MINARKTKSPQDLIALFPPKCPDLLLTNAHPPARYNRKVLTPPNIGLGRIKKCLLVTLVTVLCSAAEEGLRLRSSDTGSSPGGVTPRPSGVRDRDQLAEFGLKRWKMTIKDIMFGLCAVSSVGQQFC